LFSPLFCFAGACSPVTVMSGHTLSSTESIFIQDSNNNSYSCSLSRQPSFEMPNCLETDSIEGLIHIFRITEHGTYIGPSVDSISVCKEFRGGENLPCPWGSFLEGRPTKRPSKSLLFAKRRRQRTHRRNIIKQGWNTQKVSFQVNK
jgi:hypothetical protein